MSEPRNPWEHLLAFLESLGVDVNTAYSSDIRISAGVESVVATVWEYVKDADGKHVLSDDGTDIRRHKREFRFDRVLEPRLVQEEVPDV